MSPSGPPERLRVAQVIGSFEGGGAQRQAYNLVLGLAALGVDSRGVAVRRVGDFATWSARPEIFTELGAERGHPLKILRAGLRLRRLLRTWRPHVLHVQGADSLPFTDFCLRGVRPRPRTYFTWQDSGRVLHQEGRARARMLRALASCTGVFGSSEDVARRLQAAAHLPDVGVFHGGVPEGAGTRPGQPPLILWVGRLVAAKNPELLVRAVEILKGSAPPFRVVMTGGALRGSTYLEDIRADVRDRGLQHIIELPGYVDDDRLATLYGDAAIAVQTSFTEGLSMALLEQMMHGHAIVATDVGDTAVALDGGRCGVLLPTEPPAEALADALLHLLRDENRRRALGAAARKWATSHFSVRAMAARALKAYGHEPPPSVPSGPGP